MKRSLIFIVGFMFLIFGLKSFAAGENIYSFRWDNTYIEVEVGSALADYINLPKANLYVNGVKTKDDIAYLRGDSLTDEDTINTSVIKKYVLKYTAIASNGVEGYVNVIFDVSDRTAPKITNIAPINLRIGETPEYEKYFEITDYSEISEFKVISDEVDFNKPGTYNIVVSATDSFSNQSSTTCPITISDKSGPKIAERRELKVSYADTFNYLSYFEAVDEVDGIVSNTIETSVVDTNVLGTQCITITAHDRENNLTINNFIIEVIDDEAPVIKLTNSIIDLSVGKLKNINKDYFLSYIESITDNCASLNKDDVKVDDSALKNTLGSFKVSFSLKDDYDNECTESMIVCVVCDVVPQISVSDINVKKGESLNYYHYITVIDEYDGDITLEATIDSSSVNLNKKGTYFANVVVKNSYGKYSYKTITVHVKNSFIKEYYYIFLIPIAVGGIVAFVIIKYKRGDIL